MADTRANPPADRPSTRGADPQLAVTGPGLRAGLTGVLREAACAPGAWFPAPGCRGPVHSSSGSRTTSRRVPASGVNEVAGGLPRTRQAANHWSAISLATAFLGKRGELVQRAVAEVQRDGTHPGQPHAVRPAASPRDRRPTHPTSPSSRPGTIDRVPRRWTTGANVESGWSVRSPVSRCPRLRSPRLRCLRLRCLRLRSLRQGGGDELAELLVVRGVPQRLAQNRVQCGELLL